MTYRSRKWIFTLLGALFLASQALSSLHDTEFPQGPHDHNGVMCLAPMLDASGVLPSEDLTPPLRASFSVSVEPLADRRAPLSRRSLLPPPTGPPVTI